MTRDERREGAAHPRLEFLQDCTRTDRRPAHGIGVDFGTSNSAAAVYDGCSVTLVELERPGQIMPSAVYVTRELTVSTGRDALRAYIEGNRGRRVELAAEILGEARTSTGQVDRESGLPTTAETHAIFGREAHDAALPGRLFRGTKRLLGRDDSERIEVFGRPFRLVALITPILSRIRRQIELTLKHGLGTRPANGDACLGHPVNFEGTANGIAMARLSESYAYAGISAQSFCPEPVAAAISYLRTAEPADGRRMLTVDFGGGTLDLCVIRRSGTAFEVEAVHGIALGGDGIDQTLFRALLFPLLGKGKRWSRVVDGARVDTLFPFEAYEALLVNWPVGYLLNQNKYTTPLIDLMGQDGPDVVEFRRLYELITQNLGYEVFRAIRRLKERLSSRPAGVLDIPEIDVRVPVERAEFESLLAVPLLSFEDAVAEILRKAKLDAADVGVVLRTGGSSLIPAFRRILDRYFPGKVVEDDPFTSVAAGLAIANYHGIGQRLENVARETVSRPPLR